MNEPVGTSSDLSMQPGRFETLLMRAFDGEATAEDRAELRAWAEAEPRLAELAELRAALLEALAVPGPVDVVADVMAALDESGWSPLADALRDAVAAPVSVADAVMADLEPMDLSAFADGEHADPRRVGSRLAADAGARAMLADWADLGHRIRDAVDRPVDVWPGVATAVCVEPDAVPGWEATARKIRAAFADLPEIDVAGAVMASIEPGRPRMPRWVSLGVPLAGFLAAAAALAIAVLPSVPPEVAMGDILALAPVNDAEVEALETPPDVVAQVIPAEGGAPTIILIVDESGQADL